MNLSRNTVLSRAAAVLALPQAWTVFAVLLVAALSLWGWWLVPARWPLWVAVAAFLPALWGYVELMQSGTLPAEREQIMRWHRTVFAVIRADPGAEAGARARHRVGTARCRMGAAHAADPVDRGGRSLGHLGQLSAQAAVSLADGGRALRLAARPPIRRMGVLDGRRGNHRGVADAAG